ncbi:hypothetical protein IQ06DRAFT_20776 [Phaeosphaeriaceae sp. SRC1lsM3a]|nr:hypothetical protein IQ06DRAFT_20776 [Stagonospora sp. SRC1lsM3a]
MLARRSTFLACEVGMEMEVLADFMDTIDLPTPLQLKRIRHGLRSKQLLNLLNTFQHQSCTVERNKVYSLLSLCEEGNDFVVDYDTSEASFISQVLRICHVTACLCSSTLLAATLCTWHPPVSKSSGLFQYLILETDV